VTTQGPNGGVHPRFLPRKPRLLENELSTHTSRFFLIAGEAAEGVSQQRFV